MDKTFYTDPFRDKRSDGIASPSNPLLAVRYRPCSLASADWAAVNQLLTATCTGLLGRPMARVSRRRSIGPWSWGRTQGSGLTAALAAIVPIATALPAGCRLGTTVLPRYCSHGERSPWEQYRGSAVVVPWRCRGAVVESRRWKSNGVVSSSAPPPRPSGASQKAGDRRGSDGKSQEKYAKAHGQMVEVVGRMGTL